MDRLQVLQTLMVKKNLKNYLEIGVFNGHIFFRIKSKFKIAVDPEFQFDAWRKAGKVLLNPLNLFNQYFEKTSDAFFAEDAPAIFASAKLQLALIDGMHEYAYALRDVENCLHYLSDDGVLILHDCNALTKESSGTFAQWKAINYRGTWNGDIWKTILHLRSLRPDLTAFVLDCDHGLGVVVKKPSATLSYTQAQIESFTYEDFNRNREEWIGLKPASWFYTFFGV